MAIADANRSNPADKRGAPHRFAYEVYRRKADHGMGELGDVGADNTLPSVGQDPGALVLPNHSPDLIVWTRKKHPRSASDWIQLHAR